LTNGNTLNLNTDNIFDQEKTQNQELSNEGNNQLIVETFEGKMMSDLHTTSVGNVATNSHEKVVQNNLN